MKSMNWCALNLQNRTDEEKAQFVLICPVHKLLCTNCAFSARIPKVWLSKKLQKEFENIIKRRNK